LALAGGVGNTGIFVDTSAPRWVYNASTGALSSTTGSLSAQLLYGSLSVNSNNYGPYDSQAPLIINTPNFDGTSQIIYIGDYVGAGYATILSIDDNTNSITLSADNAYTSNINIAGSKELRLLGSGSTYVGFVAPSSITSNKIWTLPSADGSSNQVLTTNGSGTLSWSTPSGGSSVTSFNGLTGAVQGVSAAVAGTGISVSGATGSVTITNTGVQSFNGLTGAVTGVSRVNGLSGGITLAAGTGITLTASGNTITVASAPKSTTQTLDFSECINGLEIVAYGTGSSFGTSLKYIELLTSISVSVNSYACKVKSIKSFYDATNGWSVRLVVKPPFTGGVSAETVYLAPVTSVSISGYSGAALTDDSWSSIASSRIHHQDATYVVKTVTGQTWVAADSYITCKVLGITTADHTAEDAIVEGVQFEINNIVAGTGFDIMGYAPEGTYGKYTVKCIEQ
jgi:hypothetical protein